MIMCKDMTLTSSFRVWIPRTLFLFINGIGRKKGKQHQKANKKENVSAFFSKLNSINTCKWWYKKCPNKAENAELYKTYIWWGFPWGKVFMQKSIFFFHHYCCLTRGFPKNKVFLGCCKWTMFSALGVKGLLWAADTLNSGQELLSHNSQRTGFHLTLHTLHQLSKVYLSITWNFLLKIISYS